MANGSARQNPNVTISSRGSVAEGDVGVGQQPASSSSEEQRNSCCGLSKRRQHQLFALGLGLMEVGFSVSNAVSEDAFKIRDSGDFVFSSSAIMESVGLAIMFVVALAGKTAQEDETKREEMGREGGEDDKAHEVLEGFGSPLAVLASGIHQRDYDLTKAGYFGSVWQAATVYVTGLIFLYNVARRAFLVLVCVTPLGLCCCTCLAFMSDTLERWENSWLNCILFLRARQRGPTSFDRARRPPSLAWRATSILVGLPLGIDVAEVVLLILGGESWRAMILAILDILVTCVVVVPWGVKNMKAALPQVAIAAQACLHVAGEIFGECCAWSVGCCREGCRSCCSRDECFDRAERIGDKNVEYSLTEQGRNPLAPLDAPEKKGEVVARPSLPQMRITMAERLSSETVLRLLLLRYRLVLALLWLPRDRLLTMR